MSGSVPIGGYLPVSFIDWTGHVAPVLFVCGCNFRCPYCHNADLIMMTEAKLSLDSVLSDIENRSGDGGAENFSPRYNNSVTVV